MNKETFLKEMYRLNSESTLTINDECGILREYADDNCPIKKWDVVQNESGKRMVVNSVDANSDGSCVIEGYSITPKNKIKINKYCYMISKTINCDGIKIIGHQDISEDIKEFEDNNGRYNYRIDYEGD